MSSSHRTSVASSDVKKVNLKKSATKPKMYYKESVIFIDLRVLLLWVVEKYIYK